MSMLDGFFNKGFKGARCKTLLKLTIPRIKLLRNRRENQLRLMRRDIAKLLENGQEATARIRVEHIIREENINAAQEIIELFCELIAVRLPIIETQRECPIDLKEAISSICFAAPRSADLPELQQVQMLFAAKYGKEFVAAASELMPDCGVNRQIIELLSVRAPSAEAKLKLLKEIAEEHELDWDPVASETELFKPHEDLLNGPNQFVSGSTMPLPKEKYDDYRRKESDEESDTDVGLDSLDLPEVPRVSVRPSSDTAPEIHPHHPSEPDHEVIMSPPHKDSSHIPDVEPTPDGSDPLPYLYTPDAPFQVREHKHSVNFSPSPSTHSVPLQSESENSSDLPSVPSISPTVSWKNSFADVDAPPKPAVSFSPSPSPYSVLPQMKQSEGENSSDFPSISPTLSWNNSFAGVDAPSFSPKHEVSGVPAQVRQQTKSSVNSDLQDVLAAAHAAADSAERAAAAARAAASLAQVRITELISKRSNITPDEGDNSSLDQGDTLFDQRKQIPDYEPAWSSGSPTLDVPEHQSPHQPERLPSLEDDPYYSYPNLFSSQGGERQIR